MKLNGLCNFLGKDLAGVFGSQQVIQHHSDRRLSTGFASAALTD